jgi:hypothetical protein
MKNFRGINIIVFIFFSLIAYIPLRIIYFKYIQRLENRLNHTGIFIIDYEYTVWGDDYHGTNDDFKKLEINFKEDHTYSLNMSVPFLSDTVGTWVESDGGFEQFGEITYSNISYKSQTSEGIKNNNYYVETNDAIPHFGGVKIEYLALKKKQVPSGRPTY